MIIAYGETFTAYATSNDIFSTQHDGFMHEDKWIIGINNFSDIDIFDPSEIESTMIQNAKAARVYLRLGLFLAMNPPKQLLMSRRKYHQKGLRCNRRGLGLRIKIS